MPYNGPDSPYKVTVSTAKSFTLDWTCGSANAVFRPELVLGTVQGFFTDFGRKKSYLGHSAGADCQLQSRETKVYIKGVLSYENQVSRQAKQNG